MIRILFFLIFILGKIAFADDIYENKLPSKLSSVVSQNEVKSDLWKNFDVDFFGTNLFKGNFSDINFSGFNPYYTVSVDDRITLNFWGALTLEKTVTVDSQGNIFIPEVGNIMVLGVLQKDLNNYIKKKITKIFNKNVELYVNLESSKKIKIFVSGFVKNPGLYEGMSGGSILSYIDDAGGIDLKKGSFRNIDVIRNNIIKYKFDLYDFLLGGNIKYIQLHEGDVIKVNQQGNFISVIGTTRNSNRFELSGANVTGEDIIRYSNPFNSTTDISIIRDYEKNIQNFVLTLDEFKKFKINAGDKIEFLSHSITENITVLLEGEHLGKKRIVFPYDSTKLKDVVSKIIPTKRSDMNSIILYRKSAAKRQKQVLNEVLDIFEQKLLSYSPISTEDANIHKIELAYIQEFVKKARKHKPNGMIDVYDSDGNMVNVFVEDRDILHIPKITNLIATFGYVNSPTYIPFVKGKRIKFYIKSSGSLKDNAEKDYFLVRKLNGKVKKVNAYYKPEAGDEIIVLPKITFKKLQFSKDIMQIIYQMAITARAAMLF